MKISNVSALSFRAETQNPVNNVNKQESNKKRFLAQKEAPYIIGGVVVTAAAVVLGIIGHKNGWFSKAGKKIVKNSNETANETLGHNPLIEEPSVDSGNSSQNVPPTPNGVDPVQDPSSDFLNFGSWDDSELLEKGANVAHVDVADSQYVPDIIKQALDNRSNNLLKASKFYPTDYILKYMSSKDFYKELMDGSFTPNKRLWMFLNELNSRVEGILQEINRNFIVDNINMNGAYRTKEDYLKAFTKMIKQEESSLYGGKISDTENALRLTDSKGKTIEYIFNEKLDGLCQIKEIPQTEDKFAITLTYLPDKYFLHDENVGINYIHSVEFTNSKTNNPLIKIILDDTERANRRIDIYHPQTGDQIISTNRIINNNGSSCYKNTTLYENGANQVTIGTLNINKYI